jgi:hypothetical protein
VRVLEGWLQRVLQGTMGVSRTDLNGDLAGSGNVGVAFILLWKVR